MKPLAIDLFCGLGGWSDGLLAEGWDVIGFDIERHEYGEHRYPAQLVLQDILTLHGSQFRHASLIVASPPCQEFSHMAMPFSRGRQIAAALRGNGDFPSGYTGSRTISELTALFDACFRLQREASEAAGRHIPLVVENVKGAQPWVGRAKWHYGSYYLWGDIPALMPSVASLRKSKHEARHYGMKSSAEHGVKQHGSGAAWFDKALDERRKAATTTKGGGDCFGAGADCSLQRKASSGNTSRKAASALIAKIPLALARHIAAVYYPHGKECVARWEVTA